MPMVANHHYCTAQKHDGSFCDASSLQEMPFPICAKHLSEAYAAACEIFATTATAPTIHSQSTARTSVVYYAKVGDLIKIGCTASLKERLGNLPPDAAVLATEPGDRETERRRLAEFEDLRAWRREWFHPGPALLAHIEALASAA